MPTRKPPLAAGQRIRLVSMPDDPAPVPIGTEGTVRDCVWLDLARSGSWQIVVDWQNGRTLMLSVPPDTYEVLPSAA